jgi:hypothetical protein
MLKRSLLISLALLVLCSCAHKAEKTTGNVALKTENVALAKGSISVQSVDKTELLLEGQTVYCVPVTSKTKEFFDDHEGDRFIPEKLLTGVPGVRTVTIDMNNEFVLKDVPSGDYYFYWQLPYEQGMDVHNRSITNYLFQSSISNSGDGIKLKWDQHMSW